MLRFHQGWLDIEAMPENIFWAYVGLAIELDQQELKAQRSKGRQ